MSQTTAITLSRMGAASREETQSASFTVSLTTTASPAQSSVVPRGSRFGRGNTLRAIPVDPLQAQPVEGGSSGAAGKPGARHPVIPRIASRRVEDQRRDREAGLAQYVRRRREPQGASLGAPKGTWGYPAFSAVHKQTFRDADTRSSPLWNGTTRQLPHVSLRSRMRTRDDFPPAFSAGRKASPELRANWPRSGWSRSADRAALASQPSRKPSCRGVRALTLSGSISRKSGTEFWSPPWSRRSWAS